MSTTADPEHSIFSPSSAKRWTDCTASVFLTRILTKAKAAKTRKDKAECVRAFRTMFPDQDEAGFWDSVDRWSPDNGSVYAAEGTRAHEMAEKILRGEMKETDLDPEFACVLEYTSLCRVLQNRWGGEMFIESRVPLSYYPSEKGTVDNGIIGGDRICITDYKHGIGVNVDAEENLQLAAYGLSFLKYYEDYLDVTDDTVVEIRIVQPRVRQGETEKIWETTIGGLRPFQALLESKANLITEAITAGDPSKLEYKVSKDNCQFCPVKKVCPVRANDILEPVVEEALDVTMAFEMIAAEPELIETGALAPNTLLPFRDVKMMTPAAILAVYAVSKPLKAFLKDCEQYLLEQATAGHPVPGTKIVMGRQGNRYWADEESARSKALEYIDEEEANVPAKLKSYNQISASLAAADVPKDIIKAFDGWTARKPGKPVLALASDKRPAITDATDMFDLIADDESYEG